MPEFVPLPADYSAWLAELKSRIHRAQARAVQAVNRELVLLYWQLGCDILERQRREGWGAKVIDRLAHDLRVAFPKMRGLSPRNLKYMRRFAEVWPDQEFVQGTLAQLPWYHQIALLDKLNTTEDRTWYAIQAIRQNWSRDHLVEQIESSLINRHAQVQTNFSESLPTMLSDLARVTLKDPYCFEFLGLTEAAQEREIEQALVSNVTDFLLELGAGFAYVGRQVPLEVGGEDYFIDMLFFHLKLRCYVVVELKAGAFRPEHLGQLGFYLTIVDRHVKDEHDNPTIGLLLCKTKNKVLAEYALADKVQPMSIAEYRLTKSLPVELQTSLPSVEVIENALSARPKPET